MLLAEIAIVKVKKDKKISLIKLIMDNWQYEEIITEQELAIRKLHDQLLKAKR